MFNPFQPSPPSDFGQALMSIALANKMPKVTPEQRMLFDLQQAELLEKGIQGFFRQHLRDEMEMFKADPTFGTCSCIAARIDPSQPLCDEGRLNKAMDEARVSPYLK